MKTKRIRAILRSKGYHTGYCPIWKQRVYLKKCGSLYVSISVQDLKGKNNIHDIINMNWMQL